MSYDRILASRKLADNPTFAEGTPVAGIHDDLEFTGTVIETRLSLSQDEIVRVAFDPDSAVAIRLQQDHGFYWATGLSEQ